MAVDDGIRPTPPVEGTRRTHRGLRTVRITDPACFSPFADLHLPEDLRPECAECSARATGGDLVEFVAGTLGAGTYKIRFHCDLHRSLHLFVTAAALYPAWRLTQRQSQGVYICRRLDRAEQLKRIKADA